MNKFVFLSLALLGWVFWELSGGSDFEPKSRVEATKVETAPQTEKVAEAAPAALSVPIIKASAPAKSGVTATPAALIVASEDQKESEEPAKTPVVVASLATGLETFSTPGAPILVPASVTDATTSTEALPEQRVDLRKVRGSRVNMRGGPGTSFGVLIVLPRGQEVEVLRENDSGWVKLRDQESGRIGWMSARMLTAPDAASN